MHVLSDSEGAYLGTMTLDGLAAISDDGRSFEDTNADRMLTLSDPSNMITAEMPGASVRSLVGYRIAPGKLGLPGANGEASPVE